MEDFSVEGVKLILKRYNCKKMPVVSLYISRCTKSIMSKICSKYCKMTQSKMAPFRE